MQGGWARPHPMAQDEMRIHKGCPSTLLEFPPPLSLSSTPFPQFSLFFFIEGYLWIENNLNASFSELEAALYELDRSMQTWLALEYLGHASELDRSKRTWATQVNTARFLELGLVLVLPSLVAHTY